MNSKEEWKSIPRYDDYYASSLGRIKSKRFNRSKILKPNTNCKGYLYLTLCKNKIRKSMTVHSLISLTFIGNRPSNFDINHKDGNKKNNYIDNLEYCSRSDNMKHAFNTGISKPVVGSRNGKSKLTGSQVIRIKELLNMGCVFQHTIAEAFGVHKSTIGSIKTGLTWSWL